MAQPALKHVSIEEYLLQERAALEKHEYYKGEVFAMSGASLKHNRIKSNLIGPIYGKLEDGCNVYGSDLRIHIPSNTLFTYPDVVIVCGEAELLDQEMDTILNPSIIFEILSPSTQSYDRGDKFTMYRSIASLNEYILVGSEFLGIEQYVRQADGNWLLKELKSIDGHLHLPSLNITLPLAQVYNGVKV